MTKIKNLSGFKKIGVGRTLTLIKAVGMPNHPYLDVPRKIEKKQSNAIRFEGGSWLYYPSAKEFRTEHDTVVIQSTDRDGIISDLLFYKID